jgi:hypothetical protein
LDNRQRPGKVGLVPDGQDHHHVIGHIGQLGSGFVRQGQVFSGLLRMAVLPGVDVQSEVQYDRCLPFRQHPGKGVASGRSLRSLQVREVN